MTRLLSVMVLGAGLTTSASEPGLPLYGPLPTFWEELASADAVVIGTVVTTKKGELVLEVDERLKGESPTRVPLPVDATAGDTALALLFKAERSYAVIERQNPDAKSILDEWRTTRPLYDVERHLPFATGERARVTGVVKDLLERQQTQTLRDDSFVLPLLRLASTRTRGVEWVKRLGAISPEVHAALASQVLTRRASLWEAADVMELLAASPDPALTDAFFDIVKTWLSRRTRGVASLAQRAVEILARRVDPSLAFPTVIGNDREEAIRLWVRQLDARWQTQRGR